MGEKCTRCNWGGTDSNEIRSYIAPVFVSINVKDTPIPFNRPNRQMSHIKKGTINDSTSE